MDSNNEAVNRPYKGCRIFVSTTRPAGDNLFRAAYGVLTEDWKLIMLGSSTHSCQKTASLHAYETAQGFVDSLK